MPFVRDWGAINPMTGIAAGVAGYMNAYKANANQSRELQFRVDAQNAQNYGQALGNFLSPIALGGLGALAQNYGSNVNPQALVLAGSGIHPASVMNAPYGTVGSYATPEQRYGPSGGLGGGAGSAFQQQYGVDYSTAATLGKQLVGQGDVAAPYLQALGLPNAAAIQQLPAADQTGLYAQIGGMHRQMSAMTFQQAALQNAAEEKQYNMVKAGLDGGVLVGPPSAMQAYNNVRAAQERFVESRGGNVTPEQLAPFERQMRQVIRQAGFGAWNKKDPGPPVAGRDYSVDESNGIVATRKKDGNVEVRPYKPPKTTTQPVEWRSNSGTTYINTGDGFKPEKNNALPTYAETAKFYDIASKLKIPGPNDENGKPTQIPLTPEQQIQYGDLLYQRSIVQRQMATKSLDEMEGLKQLDQLKKKMEEIAPAMTQRPVSIGIAKTKERIDYAAQQNRGDVSKFLEDSQGIIKSAGRGWNENLSDAEKQELGTYATSLAHRMQQPQQEQPPVQQQPTQQPRGYKMEQVSQMPASKDKLVLNQTYTGGARPGVWRYVGLNDNGEPKFVKVTN